jgi:hypothetical protein
MSDQTGGDGSVAKEGVPIVPAYVERRENCPRYAFGGGVWIVLADKAQTAGNITNIESIYQKGGGLPRLLHEREAESMIVTDWEAIVAELIAPGSGSKANTSETTDDDEIRKRVLKTPFREREKILFLARGIVHSAKWT